MRLYRGYDNRYDNFGRKMDSKIIWTSSDIECAKEYGNSLAEVVLDESKMKVVNIFDLDKIFNEGIDLDDMDNNSAQIILENGYNTVAFESNGDTDVYAILDPKIVKEINVLFDGIPEQLDEGLTTSEFTFGFELEALGEPDGKLIGSAMRRMGMDPQENDYEYDGDEREDELFDGITQYINDKLSKIAGQQSYDKDLKGTAGTHGDESVEDEEGDGISFEYSSRILPCTPFWIMNVKKLLKSLIKDDGVFTNDTCGFHHHIHFNNMDERDMIWVYCNICSDPDFEEEFSSMYQSKYNYIEFTGRYASDDALRKMNEYIKNKDYNGILDKLNTDKFNVFRIHPQGTLEWRGPRGFLNYGDPKLIDDFYQMFLTLIRSIRLYMKSNTIIGTDITKQEFFKGLEKAKETAMKRDDEWELYHLEFIGVNRDSRLNYKSKNDKISYDYKKAHEVIEHIKYHPESLVYVIKSLKNKNIFKSSVRNLTYALFNMSDEDLKYVFKTINDSKKVSDEDKKMLVTELLAPLKGRRSNLTTIITSEMPEYVDYTKSSNMTYAKDAEHFKAIIDKYFENNEKLDYKTFIRIITQFFENIVYKNKKSMIDMLEYLCSAEFINNYASPKLVVKILLDLLRARIFDNWGSDEAAPIIKNFMMTYAQSAIKLWNKVMIRMSTYNSPMIKFYVGEMDDKLLISLYNYNPRVFRNYIPSERRDEILNKYPQLFS